MSEKRRNRPRKRIVAPDRVVIAPQPEDRGTRWRDVRFVFGNRGLRGSAMGVQWGGALIGACAALLIVLPFVGATFLERSFGDAVTVSILLVAAALALLGGALLIRRRFLIIPLLLANLALWCGVAIFITVKMNW